MGYFKRHIFFCCNQRDNGEPCCNDYAASKSRRYLKEKAKKMGLLGPGKTRVSQSAYLGRCEEGPVMVIYPDEVWYTYIDEQDLDEIIEKHLKNGKKVERLQL